MAEDRVEISVAELSEKMNLKSFTKDIDLSARMIHSYDVNRAALQLLGFFEEFDASRVQIIGMVEQKFMTKRMRLEQAEKAVADLAAFHVPCIVFTRGFTPTDPMIERCTAFGVPLLGTDSTTSDTVSEMIRWMRERLAPMQSVHGVLIDVYGEGVLIIGDSGISKSEAALELVKRGHRLVADDVVEIRKVSDISLVGSAPKALKNFIELRGIGIINVRQLFGFEAIKESAQIDMVIKIEEQKKDAIYDRLGLKENTMEFMGIKVVSHVIPIRPGRNLAIIVECAAVNNRAKKMGHNPADEFMSRLNQRFGGEIR